MLCGFRLILERFGISENFKASSNAFTLRLRCGFTEALVSSGSRGTQMFLRNFENVKERAGLVPWRLKTIQEDLEGFSGRF